MTTLPPPLHRLHHHLSLSPLPLGRPTAEAGRADASGATSHSKAFLFFYLSLTLVTGESTSQIQDKIQKACVYPTSEREMIVDSYPFRGSELRVATAEPALQLHFLCTGS
jgi:hypothetical protein